MIPVASIIPPRFECSPHPPPARDLSPVPWSYKSVQEMSAFNIDPLQPAIAHMRWFAATGVFSGFALFHAHGRCDPASSGGMKLGSN